MVKTNINGLKKRVAFLKCTPFLSVALRITSDSYIFCIQDSCIIFGNFCAVTSFSDWKLIDELEKMRAKNRGLEKPKEKITTFEEMLKILELHKRM